MKRTILLFLLTAPTFAQEINTFDFAVINSTLISPNIDLDKGRSVVAGNENQYSTYFQYAFTMCEDDVILGAGIDKSDIDRSYVGYIGKICEKFRATIAIGYLESRSGYDGTFTGFSVSWHFKENTFIGGSLENLHSTSISYDTDESSDYYRKLVPKVFASYEIIPHVIVFGQLSSRVNDIALKYQNDGFAAGGFYSGQGEEGIFGTVNFGRFAVSCSTTFDKVNFGLKFQ
ncbi:hypothetical protein SGQ83_10285 [Flavobacterium sp. Fl-318]|uniref:Uncharacterized protein n=1 Tax=Flavobacterium cupriresistens TaxID=2893885 RepID=A0ABU4RAY9_9FLAO|nr:MULTISPECIES: hypothetical protein [unclassified Flavobacterium]MDX6189739.1 hypothetical protein [Flavobacterium sp. Fl-318]UFH40854.1 hypothetical protein LNP23_13670 [Flavobacterium sp. F-323]